ncbi:MAG: hypothetical protein Q8761_02585 [Sweet potato little leaf phytoplasma]|nr:hypothetical protein [Sweet potato little leaf phytoplasma]
MEQQLMDRDRVILALKDLLSMAQTRMKKFSDRKRREVNYEIGDWVFLKIRPYRQQSLAKRRCEKLAPKYFGPFKISECVGAVAYRLELPVEASIHNVFHVSQLKKAIGDITTVQPKVPNLTENFEWTLVPKSVLGMRWNFDLLQEEWLIKWEGLHDCDASWEAVSTIKDQFPQFHLGDKVLLTLEDIVRPPIKYTYSRKGKKRM